MSNQATIERTSERMNIIDMASAEPRVSRSNKTVTSGPGHVFEKLVTNVRLKARESRQLLIGSSNSPVPPKGFEIELKPHKMPESTLVTQITAEGSTRRYDYVLEITNCSDRTVSAQVWQM